MVPQRPFAFKKGPEENAKKAMRFASPFAQKFDLAAQAEGNADRLITSGIRKLKIIKELATAGHHFQQAATSRVIALVRVQMLVQMKNAMGKQGNLHIGAAGVFFVQLERLDIKSSFAHNRLPPTWQRGVFI